MAAIGTTRAQQIIAAGHAAGLTDAQIAALASEKTIGDIQYISGRRADDLERAIAQHRVRAGLIAEALRLAKLGGHDPARIEPKLAGMSTEAIRGLIHDTDRYLRGKGIDTRTDAEKAAAAARKAEPATERQVRYILDLLARRRASGEGGGFYAGPTDEAGIRHLTREQASSYIDSLRGDY